MLRVLLLSSIGLTLAADRTVYRLPIPNLKIGEKIAIRLQQTAICANRTKVFQFRMENEHHYMESNNNKYHNHQECKKLELGAKAELEFYVRHIGKTWTLSTNTGWDCSMLTYYNASMVTHINVNSCKSGSGIVVQVGRC